MGIGNILFLVVFAVANVLFIKQAKKIIRNIKLGRAEDRSDRPAERWKTMFARCTRSG